MEDITYYIDLDNVIINTLDLILEGLEKYNGPDRETFFRNVNWLEYAYRSKSINYSVEIIKEVERLKRLRMIILTKINTVNEMSDKEFFLRKELGIYSPIMYVPVSSFKSQIAMPNSGDILIDDDLKNVLEWELSGAKSYLFNQPDINYHSKVKSLEFLLRR